MFDVSHMGEFLVEGPDAVAFVSHVSTNDPSQLALGQVQYSVFCLPDGGIVDDLLVYRMAEDRLRLVVNCANIDKDWAHVIGLAGDFDVQLTDESDDIGLIALQGPAAEEILRPLVDVDLAQDRAVQLLPEGRDGGGRAGVVSDVGDAQAAGPDGHGHARIECTRSANRLPRTCDLRCAGSTSPVDEPTHS